MLNIQITAWMLGFPNSKEREFPFCLSLIGFLSNLDQMASLPSIKEAEDHEFNPCGC